MLEQRLEDARRRQRAVLGLRREMVEEAAGPRAIVAGEYVGLAATAAPELAQQRGAAFEPDQRVADA